MLTMNRQDLANFLKQAAERHKGTDDWAKRYAEDAVVELGVDESTFLRLLKAAADAHHVYEKGLGHADENWATWYAGAMVAKSQR
mgnify:CR=1 FL=1